MTEVEFREFYGLTARPLKSYLSRLTGDPSLADDLLQESYYRLLRGRLPVMDEGERRSYLYRTATNLARDHFRTQKRRPEALDEATARTAGHADGCLAADVRQVLSEVRPAEREMMWLAYVEGASHREIAAATGRSEAAIRPLLYRARRKLAALLTERGIRKGGAR